MKKLLLLVSVFVGTLSAQMSIVPVKAQIPISYSNINASITTSKTWFVSRFAASVAFDSSTATTANIGSCAFATPAGTFKNLRVFNAGNAGITTFQVTLVKIATFSSSNPATYTETALTLNAPATTTGTITATTTESEVASNGDVYVLKVRSGANGGFVPTNCYITFDFIPN